jgi:NAD(P)-dependent dehydrogenase (short-subunit alcohol dehydrogenase family)
MPGSEFPVALVTGGARRIGRAIVADLAAHGYAVAIHANHSAGEAEALAAQIRSAGGRAGVVTADLADPAAVARLLPQAEDRLGPVTVLVNNASAFEKDEAVPFDAAVFGRHMQVNAAAPIQLASALAERLPADRGGVVVNIVDQRVLRPAPTFFSYTLSKSTLWSATRTLAQALAPRVRVAAIGPGPTLASARQRPEDFAAQAAAVPLGHGPSLAEITAAVRFILDSPSVTGQMIAVDGGQHLAWQTPDMLVPE